MQCCEPSLTQSKRLFSRGETSMDRHNHKIKNPPKKKDKMWQNFSYCLFMSIFGMEKCR